MCDINWINTFDTFDWDFAFSVLQKFDYGDRFIHMIKVGLLTSEKIWMFVLLKALCK